MELELCDGNVVTNLPGRLETRSFLPRYRAVLVILVVVLGLCCRRLPDISEGSPEASIEESRRLNVLLVLLDTVRSDHLSAYGYPFPTSPRIDEFASEAALFQNAFSHSTWTKPSIATLMTSVFPAEHGIDRVGAEADGEFHTDRLRGDYRTLAEHFRQAGYATAAIGANVHIQRKTGFAQGFDHFVSTRLLTAFEINQKLRSWLEANEAQPFFAYLHYMDAHWPYTLRLEDERPGRFGSTRFRRAPPGNWRLVADWAKEYLNERSLRSLRARYDEEIAYVDEAFGELIDWLKVKGRYDDTVVVLVADHGEGFFEHGELQHGFEPFDEVTRVPLVIRVPPQFLEVSAASVDSMVGIVDVMPTLLDIAGLRSPAIAEGKSLVPLLRGEAEWERTIYSEGRQVSSLRTRRHKLFETADGTRQCFALLTDPGETKPILANHPEECLVLVRDLAHLNQRVASKRRSRSEKDTVVFDAEEVEALKSLGYLGE